MPIYDIYSKREKRGSGEEPEVYVYDNLPDPLRVQIVMIWREVLNVCIPESVAARYKRIHDTLCREYGLFELPSWKASSWSKVISDYFLEEKNIERALDVVELAFIEINSMGGKGAIYELNYRFKEHAIGYRFEDDNIIRIDSEFIHAKIVKPVLGLLTAEKYAGAREEFYNAHEHFRKGNDKEALNECLKSFESVMKAICDERGWEYKTSANAAQLVEICFDNGLIPSFWESQYNHLIALLRDSVPTGRNQLSGHGQGRTPTSVPEHIVSYMIHMTSSAIVFLASADKSLPEFG